MRPIYPALFLILFTIGCDPGTGQNQNASPPNQTLLQARRGFQTTLVRKESVGELAPTPPAILRLITYRAPIGELAAYVSPSPSDGKKHPAIIWIFGGFSNSIGETAWEESPPENDQYARAFGEARIVMMYPSLRGGNGNPGFIEGFYGEVDDILAAVEYLEKLDYVDPQRIYLGGHSTGGTLALLVAESMDRFRSVFSFGPVGDIAGYGSEHLPFDVSNKKEVELRSPGKWLQEIRTPTFIFEGTKQPSNLASLTAMSRTCRNPAIHFHPVPGATHFSILAPVSRLIATKILSDDGPASRIGFTEGELTEALRK